MTKRVAGPLDAHLSFAPWVDPTSGVRSYLLSERIAPVQLTVYFVNSALFADERFLWFACGHSPSP